MSEWNRTRIRELEQQSLREFVQRVVPFYSKGRVLDYGCGQQPYRDVVERLIRQIVDVYVPYDRVGFPGNVSGKDVGLADPLTYEGWWNTILCTQVLHFVQDPRELLRQFRRALHPDGKLILTYTTSWEEAEEGDLWRHTSQGMTLLLKSVGFHIVEHYNRAAVELEDFRFSLGGGVVAGK